MPIGRSPGSYTQHRRLTILRELLEGTPKGLAVDEVAKKLGVSTRSVRRYLSELSETITLHRSQDATQGPWVRIASESVPRKIKLHPTQIYGLLMVRRIFRLLAGTAFEASVKGAIDQLLMQVQRPQKRAALVDVESRLEDRFLYLPATPIKALSESGAEVLDTLIDACAQLRVCSIEYVRAGAHGQSERMTIHPYALVLYKDTIYCIAWVVERNALRTLRADRVLDADVRATEHFELPAGFSVDDHFEGQFGLFVGHEHIRVVVDFDPEIAELVRGRPFPQPDPNQPSTHDLASGGVRVVMTVSSTAEVLPWILSFGKKVRVVEPPELADAVRGEARAILERY